ncbi:universal stress protein [Streptomyces sp. XD-27]|uniref:universal stress protein n=1 Tax=Streptomyces sp. XD-27 TaxID=3062779 RepID=UPI0026F438A0|nr:universal stress protein [Streptomyces sp. XD-27]WKX69114.1 universal stress protein [Streptomyces sp. XD-27]
MEDVVTVGLDGSAESLAAARWAASEADRRRLTLRLMHAWVLLAAAPKGIPAERDQNYWAERIVHDAAKELHRRHPELPIIEDLVAEEASSALLGAAAQSRMLVLGSRGLRAIESFFLGDISLYVTARAEQPVVLVRAAEDTTAGGGEPASAAGRTGVVVGLSLHGPCERLMEFAFDTAAGRGVPVDAVHGTSLPVAAYAPWGVDPDVADEFRHGAEKQLNEALRPWQERFPGVRVTGTVVLESPARALLHAAGEAELLAIGRRLHRPPMAPHLGPVAHAAMHHAMCPVAVVPHD